jgi:Protein of unknown function, DUF547
MKTHITLLTAFGIAAAAASASTLIHAQAFDHNHTAFTAVLAKHVVLIDGGKASQVNYANLGKDKAALTAYLAGLSKVTDAEFKAWNKAEKLAFLINAYNGFTLDLILQNYPVKSIKDIGGVFDDRWNRKFFTLLGQEFSLNKIEHDTVRKPGAYDEPRAHFALNCASIGCPTLREEAYTSEKLETQLEAQAVRFLSDRSRNRYAGGKLEVSMIFKWFNTDWESGYKGFNGKTAPIKTRPEYFAKYAKLLADNPADQQKISDGKAELSFLEYDWRLNGVGGAK